MGLDLCIYLGNDLNDISMFSNALEDNDFIVIANNENKSITDMVVKYMQEECKIKGIEWSDAKVLVLEEENVNSFLQRTSKLMAVLNSQTKSKNPKKNPKENLNKNNSRTKREEKLDKSTKHKGDSYR